MMRREPSGRDRSLAARPGGELAKGLDEACAAVFGVFAWGGFGDFEEELVVELATWESAIEEDAETEHGGFEAEVFASGAPVLPAIKHLQAAAVKGADGLSGESSGGKSDGGDVFAGFVAVGR